LSSPTRIGSFTVGGNIIHFLKPHTLLPFLPLLYLAYAAQYPSK